MLSLKSKLEKFGKVEQCEKRDGMIHVKLTPSFGAQAVKVFECMKVITEEVGIKYPMVEKCITNEKLFHLILKPEKAK